MGSCVWNPHTPLSIPKIIYRRKLYNLSWYQVSVPFSTISVDSFSLSALISSSCNFGSCPAFEVKYPETHPYFVTCWRTTFAITLVPPGCYRETSKEPLLIAGPVSLSVYNMSFYGLSVPKYYHPQVGWFSSFCVWVTTAIY